MISETASLRQTIFAALALSLGLSPDSSAASALIHPAYAEPENGPRPPRTRNVIYYALSREPDDEDRPQSSPDAVTWLPGIPASPSSSSSPTASAPSSSSSSPSSSAPSSSSSAPETLAPSSALPLRVRSFLAYQLLLVCYGPEAESHAHRLRTWFFLDGPGHPLSLLRRSGIYPVPDPPQPILIHEPEGSLWRSRADLTISLRVSDELTRDIPVIAGPPEIITFRSP